MSKTLRFKVGDQVVIVDKLSIYHGKTVTIESFYSAIKPPARWDYHVKHIDGGLDVFKDSDLNFIRDTNHDLLYAIQQVSGWHKQWDTHYQNSAVEQAFKKCLDLLENLRDHGIPDNSDTTETNETKEETKTNS